MKGIVFEKCNDIVVMSARDVVKSCNCGKYCAKYLNDGITLVVNENPAVFGIDNNSFSTALYRYYRHRDEFENRVDFFFVDWIPTKPGEITFVDSVSKVISFDVDFDTGNKGISTMPNSNSYL